MLILTGLYIDFKQDRLYTTQYLIPLILKLMNDGIGRCKCVTTKTLKVTERKKPFYQDYGQDNVTKLWIFVLENGEVVEEAEEGKSFALCNQTLDGKFYSTKMSLTIRMYACWMQQMNAGWGHYRAKVYRVVPLGIALMHWR